MFVHRLRKREMEGHLRTFEKLQNSLCVSRLQSCKDIISSEFTMDELNQVINKLPRGVLTQLVISLKFLYVVEKVSGVRSLI